MIKSLEKKCYFFRKLGLAEREQEVLSQTLNTLWDWDWGVQRLQTLEPSYQPIIDFKDFIIDPIDCPVRRDLLMNMSSSLQQQGRFTREVQLLTQGLKQYPTWQYLKNRLEWHERPVFHRDPNRSKTQPRRSVFLPRNQRFTPSQEAIDSLCIVIASGSDQPYFDLSIQLLESIKATRWYNRVPIKILDCGLTHDDAEYLRSHFRCEVKEPGWDVSPENIHFADRANHPKEGWKGAVARPYIHRYFPGYTYYLWLDCDMWIQNELALDKLLHYAERQGLACSRHPSTWSCPLQAPYLSHFIQTLPEERVSLLEGKMTLINSHYCIRADLAEEYALLADQLIQEKGRYFWGFDLTSLNYFFYQKGNLKMLEEGDLYYIPHASLKEARYHNHIFYYEGKVIGIMDHGPLKYSDLFYKALFPREGQEVQRVIMNFSDESEEIREEKAWFLCQKYGYQLGGYCYRIYQF